MAEKLNTGSGKRASRKRTETAAPPSAVEQAQVMGTNVTDATFMEICLEALDKKNEHEEAVKVATKANAEYRAVLKKAKKLGIMQEAVVIWLNDRKLEPAEVSRRLAQQNRIYRLMRFQVGTQLTLEQAAAAEAETDGLSGEELAARAFEKGYEIGKAGQNLNQSGYNEESPHWGEVLRGYSKGQTELAKSGVARTEGDENGETKH